MAALIVTTSNAFGLAAPGLGSQMSDGPIDTSVDSGVRLGIHGPGNW